MTPVYYAKMGKVTFSITASSRGGWNAERVEEHGTQSLQHFPLLMNAWDAIQAWVGAELWGSEGRSGA